jgi:hypothetical protein
MRFLRFVALLAIGLSLNGCVGVGAWIFWPHTASTDTPRALSARGTLHISPEDPQGAITTSAELRKHWGEPDNIVLHDTQAEEWIYTQPYWRWYGVILYAVVVPLPFMLPVGSEYVSLTVKDGQITAATRVKSAVVASAYCGVFGTLQTGLGCGTGTVELH